MNFCSKSFVHVPVKIMARKQNHQPLLKSQKQCLLDYMKFLSEVEKQDCPVAIYECCKL